MARYSKIDRRMWADEKFRRLTAPQPCGQALFVYLLTNPFVGVVPGLYSAGAAMLAEALGWSAEAFREAFEELLREGLVKADFEARLLWIPNAIRYNQPENPNVVKGWQCAWDELPECVLKREAWESLRENLSDRGNDWLVAFVSSCPEPSAKGSAKGMPKSVRKGSAKDMANQEQEQEHEQERDKDQLSPQWLGASSARTSNSEIDDANLILEPDSDERPKKSPTPEGTRLAEGLRDQILKNNENAKIMDKQVESWAREADRIMRLDGRTEEQIAFLIHWSQHHPFWLKNILSMGKLRQQFDRLTLEMKSPKGHANENATRSSPRTERNRAALEAFRRHDAERFATSWGGDRRNGHCNGRGHGNGTIHSSAGPVRGRPGETADRVRRSGSGTLPARNPRPQWISAHADHRGHFGSGWNSGRIRSGRCGMASGVGCRCAPREQVHHQQP